MYEMMDRYKKTRKILRALRTLNTDKYERQVIGGMISDCNYVVEWLQTGRRPGNRRGIERLAAYQRERPTDPIILQAYLARTSAGGAVQASSVTDEDRERIEEVLSQLTPRERDCYVMVIGHGMAYSYAAKMLGIKKSSVQWFVESAKKKITAYLFKIK